MTEVIRKMFQAASAGRMDYAVRALAPYARYPISGEYREAANWCLDYLNDNGIEAALHSYEASEKKRYQTALAQDGWDCIGGWVELVSDGGRRIADYAANKYHVYERSGPAAYTVTPVELVLMDKGSNEDGYTGVDFRGKIVFLYHVYYGDVDWVFGKRGAVGFVNCDRAEPGFEDVIKWHAIREDQYRDIFGFAITPSAGEKLRLFIKDRWSKESEPTYVRACLETRRGPSTFENVVAYLPGQTEEEILITAHLCHPQNSANDNLSGCAAGMEALRMIKTLIEKAELPPLKRGVRLLLTPEYLGSYAYVTEIGGAVKDILAGINLDMVGASQDDHNGPLLVCETPHANPSFAAALASFILEELKKDVYITSNYGYVPLFNAFLTEYCGGSDHAVWNDPKVGVPMPALGQKPDKYYHTSGDKPETLDPFIMRKSAALTASYCYLLANLGVDYIKIIFNAVGDRLVNRVNAAASRAINGDISRDEYAGYVYHYLDFYAGAVRDLKRFFKSGEAASVDTLVEEEVRRLEELAALSSEIAFDETPERPALYLHFSMEEKYQLIPERDYLGQVYDIDELAKAMPGGEEVWKEYKKIAGSHLWGSIEHQAEYYIDGKRTLGEIISAAILECHGYGTPEALYRYFKLQEFLGLIRFTNRAGDGI